MWVGTLGAVLGPNLGIPGKAVESRLGLPALSGAFVIGAVLLTVTAATVWFRMRPDPLAVAADFVRYVTDAEPTLAEAAVLRRAYEDVAAGQRSA